MTQAWIHYDEGKWMRIDDGHDIWDEPIAGWEEILDLVHGGRFYRHSDGRMFKAGDATFASVDAS